MIHHHHHLSSSPSLFKCCIGELAVLDPTQVSPISALSSTAVELYSFDVTTMQHVQCHLYAQTMSQLTESYSLHNPPNEKIAYYYR